MNRIVFTAFIAINVLDVLSTNRVLAAGGFEANPAVLGFMAAAGSAWWVPKMTIAVASANLIARWRLTWALIPCAVMALVVINNFFQV